MTSPIDVDELVESAFLRGRIAGLQEGAWIAGITAQGLSDAKSIACAEGISTACNTAAEKLEKGEA